MSTVGFIGLGTMGRPMARNLLTAGHELVIFARDAKVVEEFQQLGAVRATSPADLARQSEFIVTIVSDDDAVRQIALDRDGIVEGACEKVMLIEMSTISPQLVRQIGAALRERGMSMIDAPVSGGPSGAKSGKLSIMAGGSAADFDRAGPILAVLGEHIFHVGSLAAGQTVKLANQLIGGAIMVLTGEAMALAKAGGVDLTKLIEAVETSSGNSTVFRSRARNFVLADQYPPAFATSLMRKDMSLAVNLGRELNVPLKVAESALHRYDEALQQGFAAEDFASVAKTCATVAGIKLTD